MANQAKMKFFDEIAEKWDSWEDLGKLGEHLAQGLDGFALGRHETILDVGCGTGNLTGRILERLSDRGRILALEMSENMLRIARRKVPDSRVKWLLADALQLPLQGEIFDRIICFSVWPHFDDFNRAADEFFRVLKPSGHLHIWHAASRAAINEIHASAGEAVAKDVLASAEETAQHLVQSGFRPYELVDSEKRYLVSAIKPQEA